MNEDTTSKFIASLTKSLQAVIHGSLDFVTNIEVGGYLYVRVDNSERVDYVLSEKLQKSDINSLTFHSNSFHALPSGNNSSQDKNSGSGNVSAVSTDRVSGRGKSRSSSLETDNSMFSPPHVSSKSPQQSPRRSDSFLLPQGVCGNDNIHGMRNNSRWQAAGIKTPTSSETSQSNYANANRAQSLTDFQTAFRNQPTSTFPSQSHQSSSSSSSSHHAGFTQNGSSSRLSSTSHHPQQQQQQQQQSKSSILPDASEMEVVHIKTEEEDEVFNIPLQCQQAGAESDGLTAQGKAPWMSMRMQQPYMYPYPRLSRSQSWDRRVSMPASGSKFPMYSGEGGGSAGDSNLFLTCKICGKSYRSRQGLLFHERAKHQNVFNVYCPVCGKGFQQTTHMYGHMATHTNVKNFQCQTCGAKYAHKTSLQQHHRSGSCRPSSSSSSSSLFSAGNTAAGLDLSTSHHLLRDLIPGGSSSNQTPPRTSQSQSPIESSFGHGHESGFGQGHSEAEVGLDQQRSEPNFSQSHSETEMTLDQRRSSVFSNADLSSPECGSASFQAEDEDFPGRLVNHAGAYSFRRQEEGGVNLASSDPGNMLSMENESQSSAGVGSSVDQSVSHIVSPNPPTFDSVDPDASLSDLVIDTNRQSVAERHELDVTEDVSVSLSLSADDD